MQLHLPASEEKLSAYAALVLRLSLAAVMIAHAMAKLLLFTLPGTATFFAAHGFPGWSAYPVFALELLGGLLLALGFAVRPVAALLIPVMAGALLVHLPNGWMFTAPNGGWEYPAFLIAALAAQFLLGRGAFALVPAASTQARSSKSTAALTPTP